ncbi:MAG: condensation domain-containing protein, partial [Streptosporangiaceae bacterium]
MTDLQHRIAALSPEKRRLLEARLADLTAARGPASADRIIPRDRTRPTPLGFAQQREWAVERFRSANNITGAMRLEGRLDLPLLGRVLTEILDRNEVLRSTVEITRDGIPVQVVQPVTAVPTPVVDLSDLSPRQQREEVRRCCTAEVLRPFDPADPQRMRVTLLRLAQDVHIALFATDHAASDAWSLSTIAQELATVFRILTDGRGRSLSRPEIQFGDFAAWQRARFSEERTAAELRHWREALSGLAASSAFPTDRPTPARPTFAGSLWSMELSAELSADLGRFGEREGASLFTIMLAACSVLLYRHLEQDDLVIGSLVSGRSRVETEQLIGCFANPLPLRMRLREGQTLREVVRQARDTFTTALDHQDVPFDRVISELGLGREASQTSLSRIWINVLTVPDMTVELPSLHITPEPMDLGMASVDLTLNAFPRADRLALQWAYMTELFDRDTVRLLAEQFHGVLRQLVTAPDAPVGRVELAAPAAVRHPSPASPAAAEAGFVELFQRRVA